MTRRAFIVVAFLLALPSFGLPTLSAEPVAADSTTVTTSGDVGGAQWDFHYEGPFDFSGSVTWNGQTWSLREIVAVALVFYFLPALIAFLRGHPARWGIFVLNFLAGFTVIGWLGSLLWAFVGGSRHRVSATNDNRDKGRIL